MLGLVGAARSSQAAIIVTNGSFESPALPTGVNFTTNMVGTGWTLANVKYGGNGSGGRVRATADGFADSTPDGQLWAYIANADALIQKIETGGVAVGVTVNFSYLEYAQTNLRSVPPSATGIALAAGDLSDGGELISNYAYFNALSPGQETTRTGTLTIDTTNIGGVNFAGDDLYIFINSRSSSTSNVAIDNVQLTQQVPEPADLAAIALASMFFLRRRSSLAANCAR